MRTIKYQAIYRPTGEKFEVYKLDLLNETVHGAFDGSQSDYCIYSTTPYGYGDAWIREYTGLKDKNGTEIYEGDLVFMSEYGGSTKEVRWHEHMCKFFLINDKQGETSTDSLVDWKAEQNLEVVGNIYENGDKLL